MGKRAFILGAGASHAYDRSLFGVRPPLARSFFRAYHNLPISENFSVKVGFIVSFVRDHYGIPDHLFYNFEEDVELFLKKVDERAQGYVDRAAMGQELSAVDAMELYHAQRVKFELLLLFMRVLIDTTEGPACPFHGIFAANLQPGDVMISFNWDTLMDRALYSTGRWSPETGYGISFDAVMDGTWRLPENSRTSEWDLLKLHGSINWLICHPGLDPRTGDEISHLPPDRYHDKFCYVKLENEPNFGCRGVLFNPLVPPQRKDGHKSIVANVVIDPKTIQYAWDVRVYGDYTPYAKLAPLIIPPSHEKRYDMPGQVFDQLWPLALRGLVESDELYICGYSLPETDSRPRELLREAAKERGKRWQIRLVTPHPKPLRDKIRQLLKGADVRISHVADSFERFAAPHMSDLILPGPART